jgi:hypothetical protein
VTTARYTEWRFAEEEAELVVVSCEDNLTLDVERSFAAGGATEAHYQYVQSSDSVDEQADSVYRTGPESWALILVYCPDPAEYFHARVIAELGAAVFAGATVTSMTEWQVTTEPESDTDHAYLA